MKRVIKNKKKMKNTMYIVFGTFALLLFMITRTNPSFAEEGLIIDDALYMIVEQTIPSDNVSKEDSEVSDGALESDENIEDPELTSEENAVEGDENSQDLENDEEDDIEDEENLDGEEVDNVENEDGNGEGKTEESEKTSETEEGDNELEVQTPETSSDGEIHGVDNENLNDDENEYSQEDEMTETGFFIDKLEGIKEVMSDKTATLLSGEDFNKKIKTLATGIIVNDYNTVDNLITGILSGIALDSVKDDDHKISISDSEYPIYAWFDNGIIYIYTEANKIYLNENSSYMFYRLKNLENIDMNIFDTSKVKNMENMFAYTESMETINLKNSDLLNVENMKFMFYRAGLTSIDLSGMNLNKVKTMMDMFYDSKDLTFVDFTNIKLNSVTDIGTMFPYNCYEGNTNCPYSKLEEVKFTNAEMGSLKHIGPIMFYKNSNLKYVDFSGIDLHSLEELTTIFNRTNELIYANFDYADLRNITNIHVYSEVPKIKKIQFSHAILSGLDEGGYIADNCTGITEIDFSYADLRSFKGRSSGLRDLIYIGPYYTPNIEIINFSNANLSSLENMEYFFGNTNTLKEVNFQNTDLDNLKTMKQLFYHSKIPQIIIFKNNNLLKLSNMYGMFYESYSGSTISFRDMDLSNVTNMEQMFYGAKDIKKVDFSDKDLRKVQNMQSMFYNANDLEEIDFSGTQFRDVTNMGSMIQYTKIKTLDLSNKTFILGDAGSAFGNNPELTSVDFNNTKFIGGNLGTLFYNSTGLKEANFKNTLFIGSYLGSFFQYNTSLEKADFENAIFSGGGYMSTFFYDAPSLKEVNFNNTKFIGSYNLGSFFSKCTNIEKIDFNNVIFSGGGNMYTFFYNAPNLKEINFNNSKFIGDYNMEGMISDLPSLGKVNLDNTVFSGNFNMKKMFYNDQNLTELDLSSFDSSNITNATSMFEKSSNLKTIYATDKFNRIDGANSASMFSGAESLIGGNGTSYDSNYITGIYAIIDDEINSGYFTNILDKPYAISYKLNGGTILGENKTTYTARDEFNLINPAKEGYTFLGWTGSNGLDPEITVKIAEFTVGDLEFTANWKINQYKIIFDTDGGNEIDNMQLDYNTTIPNLPTPTKECNSFSGWDIQLPETMPAHDITLKAVWNYTCSRSSGAGGRKSEATTREIAIDTNTENEHNSADEKENTKTSEENKTTLNDETSNQVISVMQEISEDGTVEAVIETVKIRNTDIIATVRTEVNPISSFSSTTHTKEQKDAYSFAKSNGITTTKSIETAKMDTELTRIQMAKMVSNYAINVLGQEPDTSKGTVQFKDVTEEMNKQYDNAVTKAYQLGIMGQNVNDNKFRPNDEVSRAEFSATLSRLLYHTEEGKYRGTGKYYVPHIAKLYNEGIINKVTPRMKEKRGYVMTMLMRTVK